jgi:hypothetical protein
MEKVVYVVVAGGASTAEELGSRLLSEVAPSLVAGGALGVQVNVVDEAVRPAHGHRIASSAHPADAVVSLWVHSAADRLRSWADAAIGAAAGAMAAYLVTESVPLPNTRHPAPDGEPTPGFAQVAFLQRPAHLPEAAWRRAWLEEHTPIAIETQDTFLYVQNVVVRPLTGGAPPWAGIVEECFPAAAMTDPHAFFDAVGDDDRLRANQQAMYESCARFIDLATIDVLPTSRHVVRTPRPE